MVDGKKHNSTEHKSESRRDFLKIGLGGFSSLSLPGLYQLQAAAAEAQQKLPKKSKERTAVILVWLRGGASHLETYDPKPDAVSDYRGPYSPIATKTEGLFLSELLPRHATISDKFTILRSITHTGGGHLWLCQKYCIPSQRTQIRDYRKTRNQYLGFQYSTSAVIQEATIPMAIYSAGKKPTRTTSLYGVS